MRERVKIFSDADDPDTGFASVENNVDAWLEEMGKKPSFRIMDRKMSTNFFTWVGFESATRTTFPKAQGISCTIAIFYAV